MHKKITYLYMDNLNIEYKEYKKKIKETYFLFLLLY